MIAAERDILISMFGYGHEIYQELKESNAIITTEAEEFKILLEKVKDAFAQFNLETATWGLDYYEKDAGLRRQAGYFTWADIERKGIVFNDIEGVLWRDLHKYFAATIEERKEFIKARWLGSGVITVNALKDIVKQFNNGTIEVVEDYPNYTITVRFVDEKGSPANLNEIKALIREYVPAHIAIDYYVKYLTWGDVAEYKWEQLTNVSWGDVKGGLI